MQKRKVTIILLAVLLIGGPLLTPGCAQVAHWDVSYDPKIASDGAGGAIALYDVMKNSSQRDFYAQRLGAEGQRLWGENGKLIGSAQKGSIDFVHLKIVTDGHGGAIITRMDAVSERNRAPRNSYLVIRVSPSGEILWQIGVNGVDGVIGDGDGGAIIAFAESSTMLVIKIGPDGRPSGHGMVSMTRERYQANSLQLASDGAGGAVIAWLESDLQRAKPNHPSTTEEIHAQRIDRDGNLAWGQEGLRLCISPENAAVSWLRLSDGNLGNPVLAWEQHPTVVIQGDSAEALLSDICVQKMDVAGATAWPSNGLALGISKAAGVRSTPHAPLIVGDGEGGAIIVWQDMRDLGSPALYAKRVSANGTVNWAPGGTKVFDIAGGGAYSLQTAGGGKGGLIVSLTFRDFMARSQGIRVRELDADGNRTCLAEPVNITVDETLSTHYTLPDGEGGAILAWGVRKTDLSNSEAAFVQRIDANGKLLWGNAGVRLDQ